MIEFLREIERRDTSQSSLQVACPTERRTSFRQKHGRSYSLLAL